MKKLRASVLEWRAKILRRDLFMPVFKICSLLTSIATLGVSRASSRVPLISSLLVVRARLLSSQP